MENRGCLAWSRVQSLSLAPAPQPSQPSPRPVPRLIPLPTRMLSLLILTLVKILLIFLLTPKRMSSLCLMTPARTSLLQLLSLVRTSCLHKGNCHYITCLWHSAPCWLCRWCHHSTAWLPGDMLVFWATRPEPCPDFPSHGWRPPLGLTEDISLPLLSTSGIVFSLPFDPGENVSISPHPIFLEDAVPAFLDLWAQCPWVARGLEILHLRGFRGSGFEPTLMPPENHGHSTEGSVICFWL